MALDQSRTTQSASTLAQETLDEEERKKKEKKAQQKQGEKGQPSNKLGGAGGGASTGASAGAVGGPVGAIIGAGVGAAAGAAEANQNEKDAASAGRPERRRMTAAYDAYKDRKARKERALATLSQAVFDWAANIR